MANIKEQIEISIAGETAESFNALQSEMPFPMEITQGESGIIFKSQKMEWIVKNLFYAGKQIVLQALHT